MRKKISSFLLLASMTFTILAQSEQVDSLHAAFDQMYGLDMALYSGKKYSSEIHPIQGHPFWRNQDRFTADIVIEGVAYRNKQLKYNLYKQAFILYYKDYNELPHQIILNTETIDSVRGNSFLFVKNVSHPELNQPFLKVIYEGQIACYSAIKKELHFRTLGEVVGNEFSEELKEHYLIYGNKVYPFQKKRTFLQIFSKQEKRAIRKYIKSNGINFRDLSDEELKQLTAFVERIEY
jgi:hypothetical protein